MSPRPRAVWTAAADAVLVGHFNDEYDAGRQAESGWKKTSYESGVTVLAAHNISRTVTQVQDRWSRVSTTAHPSFRILTFLIPLSAESHVQDCTDPPSTVGLWVGRGSQAGDSYLCRMECIPDGMFPRPRYAVATDDFASQAHPDAKPFRDKSFPLYDDLARLCESVIATGINVVAAGPRRSCTTIAVTQVPAATSSTPPA